MAKTFCSLPFKHLCLGPEGTARVCCVTDALVTDHGAPMSLNEHTFDEIFNSAYMRNTRRAMLAGEPLDQCAVCYASEAASGKSYRTEVGLQDATDAAGAPLPGRYGADDGYRVDASVGFLKLELGNLCNLKCRMCYGAASSQIERDPVHSRWNGGVDPLHAIWRDDVARIGPEPRIAIQSTGIYEAGESDGTNRFWTDGHAVLRVPLQRGTRLARLDIGFVEPGAGRPVPVRVIVNNRPLFRGVSGRMANPLAIDLARLDASDELVIEIVSDAAANPYSGRPKGVAVSSIELCRQADAVAVRAIRPELVTSCRPMNGPWYMDDRTMFGEIMKSPDKLTRLCFTGGEPFISDRLEQILDFLIDRKAAQNIQLELVTNCTRVEPALLDRLQAFRQTDIYFSLDAVGPIYEYIRFPARWKTVDRNARLLSGDGRFNCAANPTIQIYNILDLVDLFRYCDSLGINCSLSNVLNKPERLAIRNLPPRIRSVAAGRLRAYAHADCQEHARPAVLSLAQYLEEPGGPPDRQMIHEFMAFTNDLDATRGQDFRSTYPEFVRLLAEDGFEWSDERLHARGNTDTLPARERIHAWL